MNNDKHENANIYIKTHIPIRIVYVFIIYCHK